ncbi:MAG: DUF2892 domain-containing protein [Gammaproteobacteria bacterium]|nr:DUF2892 domain-containing protein [Gammaproteobacteria bacterium]MBU1490588.1 DUF2892 domain-containing protein [Gammaproteobacteria bacterium]MBU2137429.1 DUF2892 domain-containing protein [Gammaproteobacteria bacterium]MBU2218372.1 DUF2892 domain-containing protein [Gammaproteobacteria bacterium]MBU2324051.1 DUF2892 domain-containing protein [Gammaproteobacteria bacterium]
MIETPPRIDPDAPFNAHNVQGWERTLSVGLGLALMGVGLARGGLFGLCKTTIGGAMLARGLSGHCSVKSLLNDPQAEMNYLKDELQAAKDKLSGLLESAKPGAAHPAPAPVTASTPAVNSSTGLG